MILATLVMLIISPRRLSCREILFLSAALFAALRSVRHIPVFVLIAVPVLCKLTEGCIERYGSAWLLTPKPRPGTWRTAVLNAVILAAFGTFTFARIRYVEHQQPEIEAERFPARAVQFICSQHPTAPMLNHYSWGGYFIWKLYPNYRVFIDCRADLYGDSFMNEFAASYYLAGDWRKSLRTWGIRTIVLPPDAPLVTALQSQPGWRRTYADSQAVVLIQASSSGRSD